MQRRAQAGIVVQRAEGEPSTSGRSSKEERRLEPQTRQKCRVVPGEER